MATRRENSYNGISWQTKIYILIAVFLVFMSVILLILYYLQPIEKQISFVDKINFNEIDFESSPQYKYGATDQVNMLTRASAKIGSLTVKNNGYLTHVYRLPLYRGCIIFSDNFKNNIGNYNPSEEVQISFGSENDYYLSEQPLNIVPQESVKKNIYAHYTPYSIPTYLFTKENILKIEVYELQQKNKNPIYYEGDYYSNYCNELVEREEPIKTIYLD